MADQQTWQRRVRRLLMLTGSLSTVYFFLNYLVGRMRDARVKSLKERREREMLKAHFNSLLSTISFTLYALLPTVEPQLFAEYPVEATSQALQAKVRGTASPADTGTTEPTPGSTPADSLLLDPNDNPNQDQSAFTVPAAPNIPSISTSGDQEPSPARHLPSQSSHNDNSSPSASSNVPLPSDSSVDDRHNLVQSLASVGTTGDASESWASEFSRDNDDDVLTASTTSQPISLPPTDTSSVMPSPFSDISRLDSSPPARIERIEQRIDPRTKKQLWKDLKTQSLSRAFVTVYLVPLIYLLTSSQLTILARTRYLTDVKTSNAQREVEREQRTAARKRSSLFNYFSVESMGLSDYVERGANAGASLIPSFVKSWFSPQSNDTAPALTPEALALREQQLEEERAEAERLFLTYSWWLLHEGWRTISTRVETSVNHVFGGVPLKREITPETWAELVREIRALVETDVPEDEDEDQSKPSGHSKPRLFDFTPLVVPPTPLPPTYNECPLPVTPEGRYLQSLLDQTREHVGSADARLLLDRGVSAMFSSLSDSLFPDGQGRRLAELLPELNAWSRGVWEGVPDGGVESLLSLPEFEAFTALIFGDWAPRDDGSADVAVACSQ